MCEFVEKSVFKDATNLNFHEASKICYGKQNNLLYTITLNKHNFLSENERTGQKKMFKKALILVLN